MYSLTHVYLLTLNLVVSGPRWMLGGLFLQMPSSRIPEGFLKDCPNNDCWKRTNHSRQLVAYQQTSCQVTLEGFLVNLLASILHIGKRKETEIKCSDLLEL